MNHKHRNCLQNKLTDQSTQHIGNCTGIMSLVCPKGFQLSNVLIKAVFSEENYVPPTIFLCKLASLKIMVLSYGDHLSNNILWAEMVIRRNGYGPKWSWTVMGMGRIFFLIVI